MTIEKTKQIFDKIDSTSLTSLKNDLLEKSIRYAGIRANWYFMDSEEQKMNDELRTITHNALIDAFNILSREMIKIGEDSGWRSELGGDRKEIGDFACFVHCLLGLCAR